MGAQADDDPHGGAAGAGAGGDDPHAAPPRGRPRGGEAEAPEDGAMEDPTLPRGTIQVHILDAKGKPMPRTEVTVGIIYNSVAKGESRKRVTARTDEIGTARFQDLDTGAGVAYRVMVMQEGATFSATPFQLGQQRGMRALLHVYPVSSDVEQSRIVSQSMLYAELKDDRVQLQQAFVIYNFGANAWVPSDLVIPLPPEYTAFATQQGMTDQGVDAVAKKGVRIRGTFPPGKHVLEFRWQLPYGGESEVKFAVGMAPNLAAARVVIPAAKGMILDVAGFGPAESATDEMGQRALKVEKQLRREEPPMKTLDVTLRGLPTDGPGRLLATMLASGLVIAGVVLGARKPPRRDTKAERRTLLASLETLEQGRLEGSIGPKTYERAKRALMDDLARTFAEDRTKRPASSKPSRARA